MENIFVAKSEVENTSAITYTDIIDTIPKDKISEPVTNWENTYNKEWRWRILIFNDRKVAEISYRLKNKERIYFIPHSQEWAERKVPVEYDQFVTETYYHYE